MDRPSHAGRTLSACKRISESGLVQEGTERRFAAPARHRCVARLLMKIRAHQCQVINAAALAALALNQAIQTKRVFPDRPLVFLDASMFEARFRPNQALRRYSFRRFTLDERSYWWRVSRPAPRPNAAAFPRGGMPRGGSDAGRINARARIYSGAARSWNVSEFASCHSPVSGCKSRTMAFIRSSRTWV